MRRGVIDGCGPGPVNRSETHGAGFATGIKLASGELVCAEERAGAADGDYFGVGRRIVAGGDKINAFRDDAAVAHDDGSERTAGSAACVFHRETDGVLHELAGIQREPFRPLSFFGRGVRSLPVAARLGFVFIVISGPVGPWMRW